MKTNKIREPPIKNIIQRVRSPLNRVDFGADEVASFDKNLPPSSISPLARAKSPTGSIIKKDKKQIVSSPLEKRYLSSVESTLFTKREKQRKENSSSSSTKIEKKVENSYSPKEREIINKKKRNTIPKIQENIPIKEMSDTSEPPKKKKISKSKNSSSSSPPHRKKTPKKKKSNSSSSPKKKSTKKKNSTPYKKRQESSSDEKQSKGKIGKEDIISNLTSIANYYNESKDPDPKMREKDKYRSLAFSNTAILFSDYKGEITQEALTNVRGTDKNGKKYRIGPDTAASIVEMYKTGESIRLNLLKKEAEEYEGDNPKNSEVIKLFETIKYVGPEKSKELYKAGYKTIKDVKKNKKEVKLTASQKLALKHYKDLLKKIPRDEMDAWNEIFIDRFKCKDYLKKPKKNEFTWALTGSYRRGASSSSDLDLIILKEDNEDVLNMLKKYKVGIFGNGPRSLSGLVQLNADTPVRYIDITNFNKEEWPFGLLHSTGSADFVKVIQLRARDLDYKILNSFGLFDQEGEPILIKTEKKIFKKLKVEYISPKHRGDKVKITEL